MKIDFDADNTIIFYDGLNFGFGKVMFPVILEGFDNPFQKKTERLKSNYTKVEKLIDGSMTGVSEIKDEEFGSLEVTDNYIPEGTGEQTAFLLKRKLIVKEGGKLKGLRLLYEMELFSSQAKSFGDLRYFAPPAIYDKNDLDEDGIEDYFHTKKTIYRDDRFNYPMFTAYDEKTKKAVRIERAPLPLFDATPVRPQNPETNEPAANFIQKTDIGSMGADGEGDGPVKLTACYPFYEGNATIGLYIIKTVPFGAFWPLEKGEEMHVSYRIGVTEHANYHDACWHSIRTVLKESRPEAEALKVSPEELVEYRLKALDKYYIEKTAAEDEKEPAGYVLNCHPQNGKQLENIIQYGFTGQNILNAYNVLRFGRQNGNKEYIRRAIKTADFFSDVIHIKNSGMFYNLYNIDMKKVNFWWTGLLLPLAYAKGNELAGLMGPLYEYRKAVIDTLSGLEGAYLRCMNEDVTALLKLYLLERDVGNIHENWIEAILNYGKFLLRTQEEDGSWYRAYTLSGKPITEPEIWFGGTVYEKKSSTGTSISLLIDLYHYTGDDRYLQSAKKAGDFVRDIR